jgi:hypothetical protein
MPLGLDNPVATSATLYPEATVGLTPLLGDRVEQVADCARVGQGRRTQMKPTRSQRRRLKPDA